MKISIALTALAALTLSACAGGNSARSSGAGVAEDLPPGNNITASFLQTYSGKFVDSEFGESLVIQPDGTMVESQVRQVGREDDPRVPYQTVCNFAKTGTILGVIERGDDDRKNYMDYATHEIVFQVTEIKLIAPLGNTPNDKHCADFINEMNEDMAKDGGSLQWTLYSELLGPDQIRLHTSGGGDYVPGKPRTPSTLDEVHIRVK